MYIFVIIMYVTVNFLCVLYTNVLLGVCMYIHRHNNTGPRNHWYDSECWSGRDAGARAVWRGDVRGGTQNTERKILFRTLV